MIRRESQKMAGMKALLKGTSKRRDTKSVEATGLHYRIGYE